MLPYGSKVSPLKPTRGAHSSSCSPIDSKFCTRCMLSCVNEYTPFIVNLNSKLYFKNVSPWVCPGERIESVTFFFTSLLWREKYKRWKNVTIYVVFHFFFSLYTTILSLEMEGLFTYLLAGNRSIKMPLCLRDNFSIMTSSALAGHWEANMSDFFEGTCESLHSLPKKGELVLSCPDLLVLEMPPHSPRRQSTR